MQNARSLMTRSLRRWTSYAIRIVAAALFVASFGVWPLAKAAPTNAAPRDQGNAQAATQPPAGAAAQGQGAGGRGRGAPPRTASQAPPPDVRPQSYPPEQVQAGQPLFAARCGFCHGRDAAGGETGPDLTRSTLVAEDLRGDKIGPLLRSGRTDKGMPAFDLSDADLNAIVAFIHDQKTKGEAVGGGRRSVEPAD